MTVHPDSTASTVDATSAVIPKARPGTNITRRVAEHPASHEARVSVEIPQLGRWGILGVWSAAALPMAVLAWVIAPAMARRLPGEGGVPMAQALIVLLGAGLVWQFLLVALLIGRERRSIRWPSVRDALWLRSPQSPGTGQIGGRVWLVVIPLFAAFSLSGLIPSLPHSEGRDFSAFLTSDEGRAFLAGNWTWLALILTMLVFNTVLGEELLFRGYLLPRMNGVFGHGDWVANGVLFAAYHLHAPWVMLTSLADAFVLSYPTKRYRSTWIGIAVHSAQSLLIAALVLTLVIE